MTEDKDKAEEAEPTVEAVEAEDAEDAEDAPDAEAPDEASTADVPDPSDEPGSAPDSDPPPFELQPAGDVAVMTLASFGVYSWIWRWRAAKQLEQRGAELPPFWLLFTPIVYWYWLWKWAGAVRQVSQRKLLGGPAAYLLGQFPVLGAWLAQAWVNHAYPDAMPPPRVGPPRGWLLAAQLFVPLQLTAGAVAIHWALNVPAEVIVSPRDQGAKTKQKKKPRANDRRAQRGNKKLDRKPRSDKTLERALARWSRRKFEDEPVVVEWARRHQTLVSKAFIEARRAAFDGAPEEPAIALASTACKTVRCRFVVRSPFTHELDAVTASLRRVQAEGEGVWRMFEVEDIGAPEGEPPEDKYLQLTIAWQTDEIEPAAIEVAPPEPAAESGGEAPSPEPEDASEPKPAGHAAAG